MKFIEEPVPRLQHVGGLNDECLYTIDWTHKDLQKASVRAYQKSFVGAPLAVVGLWNNLLRLKPGVGDALVKLNGLLRPLIHREWSSKVARLNALPEAQLEDFLFGSKRIPLDAVRDPLREVEGNRCFFCQHPLKGWKETDVDHFIPWSRYAYNGIHNLVIAHSQCNQSKSDFLAAPEHVRRWAQRVCPGSPSRLALEQIAGEKQWEFDADRLLSVSRAVYWRLPPHVKLWQRRVANHADFVNPDPDALREALACPSMRSEFHGTPPASEAWIQSGR